MNKKAAETMVGSYAVGLIIALILIFFVGKLVADTVFPFFLGSKEKSEVKYEPIQVEPSILSCIDQHKDIITKASNENELPQNLIKALIIQESSCKNEAVSKVGAAGLTQLMGPTAKEKGLNVPDYGIEERIINGEKRQVSKCNSFNADDCDLENDERFDPEKNIIAGTKYLKEQLDEFNGDVELALAAYNWGPNKVKTNCYEKIEFCDFGDNEETPKYVANVLSIEAGLSLG